MKVRVKTLEELGGRRPELWNDSGKMDYLMGQTIEVHPVGGHWHYQVPISEWSAGYWCLRQEDLGEIFEDETAEKAPSPEAPKPFKMYRVQVSEITGVNDRGCIEYREVLDATNLTFDLCKLVSTIYEMEAADGR